MSECLPGQACHPVICVLAMVLIPQPKSKSWTTASWRSPAELPSVLPRHEAGLEPGGSLSLRQPWPTVPLETFKHIVKSGPACCTLCSPCFEAKNSVKTHHGERTLALAFCCHLVTHTDSVPAPGPDRPGSVCGFDRQKNPSLGESEVESSWRDHAGAGMYLMRARVAASCVIVFSSALTHCPCEAQELSTTQQAPTSLEMLLPTFARSPSNDL